MNKKKNEVFDPKERPSDSRCIPRKGARQPGIESHLHYSYECGKGVVQPASCMPGLEEWVHSRQYREPSSSALVREGIKLVDHCSPHQCKA